MLLALALLAVGAGYFFHVSQVNRERAAEWEARADTLLAQKNELSDLLDERTTQVNNRTAALNATTKKLKASQAALKRSESDVSSLAKRQRQLANEKAQVEDQRANLLVQAATLETVAEYYEVCSLGMIELLDSVLDEDYRWASANIDSIFSDCETASQGLQSYKSQYGG